MASLMRIPSLLLLLMLALPPSALEAKGGGRIIGTVQGKDGQALFGAVVTIFKKDQDGGTISFTRSDRSGAFSLNDISPGSYLLQISREGFRPFLQQNLKVIPGRTLTLEVILQDFIDLISSKDPRNWDLKTVLRSTSDRRLIFRHLEGGPAPSVLEGGRTFVRGGTVEIASSAGISSHNYSVLPSNAHNGIVSNFAYAEPVGDNGRMIFSGQLNSGYDTFWRVRNTFNYRTEPGREYNLALGYGRLNLNGINLGTLVRPAEFFNQDPDLRDSGIQTLSLGLSARNEFLDAFALEYGFEISRIHHGITSNIVSPHFQFILTPSDGWRVRSTLTSRRFSDHTSLLLPGGEMINLAEPVYIAKVDGEVRVTELRHSEFAVGRDLGDETSLEVAVYKDDTKGPGTPFLLTVRGASGSRAYAAQLREDQSAQQGLRVAMHRNLLDFIEGSLIYVYGTASRVEGNHESVAGDLLADNILNFIHRSYYHTLVSFLRAQIPSTQTSVTTILRWHPGNPLTPIDLFNDRIDSPTKGVNFAVRQAIPLPEFMGSAGRWEALVDVRNLFDQGKNLILTRDGEIVLNRNPRSLRFGLNLNFF